MFVDRTNQMQRPNSNKNGSAPPSPLPPSAAASSISFEVCSSSPTSPIPGALVKGEAEPTALPPSPPPPTTPGIAHPTTTSQSSPPPPAPRGRPPLPYAPPAEDSASEMESSFSSFGFHRDRTPSLPALSARNSTMSSSRVHHASAPSTSRDARDETLSAVQYTFDRTTLTWKESGLRVTIRHPNRGVGQDDLFAYFSFLVRRVEENNSQNSNVMNAAPFWGKRPIPMLGRVFRHNIEDVSEGDYFGLAQSQHMCEEFVKHFNQSKEKASRTAALAEDYQEWIRHPFPFLTGRVLIRIPPSEIPREYQSIRKGFFSYRTQDTRELFIFLEPDVILCDLMNIPLTPSLEEYYSTAPREREGTALQPLDRHVYGESVYYCLYPRARGWEKIDYLQMAEAFTHYCHTCTLHRIIACGLRRGGGFLTDPLLNSLDRKQFGMENGGLKEITKWAVRHSCNDICRALHLPPPRASQAESESFDFSAFQIMEPSYYMRFAMLLCDDSPLTTAAHEEEEEEEEVEMASVVSASEDGWNSPRVINTKDPIPPKENNLVVRSAAEIPVVDPHSPFPKQQSINEKRVVKKKADAPLDLASPKGEPIQYPASAPPVPPLRTIKMPSHLVTPRGERPKSPKTPVSPLPAKKKPTPTRPRGATPTSSDGKTPRTPRGGRAAPAAGPRKRAATPGNTKKKTKKAADPPADPPQELEKFAPTPSGSSYLKAVDRPLRDKARQRSSSVGVSAPKVPTQRGERKPKGDTTSTEAIAKTPKRQAPAPPPVKAMASDLDTIRTPPKKPEAFSRSQSESALTPSKSRRLSVAQEEPKMFDMKNVYPATKYRLDLETLQWKASRTYIRVVNPDVGVAQGGMRVCFEVNEVDPANAHSEEIPNVAKMYRRNISKVVEEDYFNEGEVQLICAALVRDFNNRLHSGEVTSRNKVLLEMMECSVCCFDRRELPTELQTTRKGFFSYRTTDSHQVYFTMEPKLEGHFTKYNGNFGESYPTNEKPLPAADRLKRLQIFETAEALSHFSFLAGDKGLLICDIQGVAHRLTDPELHTHNREGMGIGNMGMDGIQEFVRRHKCTRVCKLIGLTPFVENEVVDFKEESRQTNRYLRILERLRSTATASRIEKAPESFSKRQHSSTSS